MLPDSGGTSRQTALKSVVFPAPFGPMMPTISPEPTVRSTAWSATTPPKCTDRPLTSRLAAVADIVSRDPTSGKEDAPWGRPMALSLSPLELEFRDEIRAWLHGHHPGPSPAGIEEQFDFRLAWQQTLHDAGYAGISWPQAYGGRGATLMQQTIFNEEMVRARAPAPANILGPLLGGPVVMAHGTEEQKRRFLAPILSGAEMWCQGFSEPDAGSDLAAVRTRADRVDGGWKITGQKV